uniref:Green fluorescent protein-like protein n=1 Tax=Meandrina meandrites TaxID=51056 RepID=Q86LV8_9CNID|nr:green fluorescent protein-like protein [Meandrina meandrites]
MAVPTQVKMKYSMDGNFNGQSFTVVGEGTGNPYEGHQSLKLTVKGEPLPFAFDILSATFTYGNRVFTKYPEGKTDYFKEAFPGGLTWERTMTFEDGGICTVAAEISLTGSVFEHKSKFVGVNFPANGPVIQKKTLGWETSTEKMAANDGSVQGYDTMFLKLEGGGRHKCYFVTNHKAKRAVKVPDNHFVWHRLVRNGDGNTVELEETAEARYDS